MSSIDSTDILVSLRRIIRSINLESKRIQKEHGVSIPQLLCLKHLKDCKDFRASSKDLCSYLQLNASTVTGIIKRLEKKGLLAKLPKTGDKRLTFVVLTSPGAELLDNIPALQHDRLAQRLQLLPGDELENMSTTIDKIVDLMDASGIDASPLLTGEEQLSNAS